MFRIFGLIAIVLGVWWSAHLYMQHAEQVAEDHAVTFGDSNAVGSPAQRAGDKVRKAFAQGTEVRERLMPEE